MDLVLTHDFLEKLGLESKFDDVQELDTQAKADLVFNMTRFCDESEKMISRQCFKMGFVYKFIRDNKLYQYYSDDVNTWTEYLKQINKSRSAVHNYISVYEHFNDVVEQNAELSDVQFTRMIQATKHAKNMNSEEKEDLLHKAKETDSEGWNNTLKEIDGEQTTDTCEHTEKELFERCVCCGKFFKADTDNMSNTKNKNNVIVRKNTSNGKKPTKYDNMSNDELIGEYKKALLKSQGRKFSECVRVWNDGKKFNLILPEVSPDGVVYQVEGAITQYDKQEFIELLQTL